MAEEHKPLTFRQIERWADFIKRNTNLSAQEAEAFVRIFQQNKSVICEQMDIEKDHLNTVLRRVDSKVGDAKLTYELGRLLSTHDRPEIPTMPIGSALIGCSGPDCENDVQTAKSSPTFENYYTKTINLHDHDMEASNVRQLHFCSRECLDNHDRLAQRQRALDNKTILVTGGGVMAQYDDDEPLRGVDSRVIFRPAGANGDNIRGLSPDIVIIVRDMDDEVYSKVIGPMKATGAEIIDLTLFDE